MPIETFVRGDFGQRRIYFMDKDQGLAYTLLTGRKTLTLENKHALEVLGVRFDNSEAE